MLVNSQPKRLVIASSGRCIWEDLKKIPWETYDMMGINDLIMHIPNPLKYGYSNDARRLQLWALLRRRGYEGPESLHSMEPWPALGGQFPIKGHKLKGLGTSPLSACYVGLELGYDQILLAGVPLDDSGHYFDPPDIETNRFHQDFYKQEAQLKWWKEASKEFDGKVKSLSGHTRELLGDNFTEPRQTYCSTKILRSG